MKRLMDHRNGNGSAWTRLHRPEGGYTKLCLVPSGVAPGLLEDMLVKTLMMTHGIDAVRGGTYSRPVLSMDERMWIQRELEHAHTIQVGKDQITSVRGRMREASTFEGDFIRRLF